jgi:hypothetical protein
VSSDSPRSECCFSSELPTCSSILSSFFYKIREGTQEDKQKEEEVKEQQAELSAAKILIAYG